ncbi:asparaginase [Acetohalobium arabaticum]|uniref:asparaginase n=1 Tax=Acetohalobium arabaticum (strain ATCC 49924 / DSM 5501 / Z-7288) TaxID=574087 RepID=D9QV03_ACEAZ|nr:asparaginase [Acetohalobium arabaticum]ADL12062.1 L-asparaginase, type I [Acetohalobium arabaticum DSM 5501]
MKKILFITTGGTIASSEGDNGLEPSFDAEELLAHIPEIRDLCDINGKLVMNIDSTNMRPTSVKKIAETVFENYDDYDGFVVTHGTDTMGYTSSLLTYMLSNIKKPVVVTGSQVAIGQPYTDAKKNISDAVRFALEGVPGIFVAFDGKIINGTRAIKMRSKSMNAFESINRPYVASIKLGKITYNGDSRGNEYENEYEIMNIDPSEPFRLRTDLCTDVFVLKLYPGIDPDIFDFIKENYKGLVIETFGLGGIPNLEDYNIVSKVKEVIEAGVVVAVTTQCVEEGVNLGVYEVGRDLAEHNKAIITGDMNTEAIVGKLMWALGNFNNLSDVKCFMETPIFGDMSVEEK